MIGLYVLMIAAIGLAASAGYALLSTVRTSVALSTAERNAARLDQAVTALRQVVLVTPDGAVFAPMGEPADPADPQSRTAPPGWAVAWSRTGWGASFGYCPYAPDAWSGPETLVTGVAVRDRDGVSHLVDLLDTPVVHGAARAYVAGGARASHPDDSAGAPDVLAFLVSPANGSGDVPACDAIFWDGGAFLVEGSPTGSVRAVTVEDMAQAVSAAPRILRRHASPAGGGSGLTSGEPASLGSLVAEWRTLQPGAMTIELAAGLYDIDPETLDLGAGPGTAAPAPDQRGRILRLVGETGAIFGLADGKAGRIRLSGDMVLSGVSFEDDAWVALGPDASVLFDDVALSRLDVGAGRAVLSGASSVTAPAGTAGPPVEIGGGRLVLAGTVLVDAVEGGGAAVRLRGGELALDGATSVLDAGGAGLVEAGGLGRVDIGEAATLTVGGVSRDLALEPRHHLAVTEIEEVCTDGTSPCTAACTAGRRLVSGGCSASGTNVFLVSQQVEDGDADGAADRVTCAWAAVAGTVAGLTAPDGPLSPTARAVCTPLR